ncbi:MAG: DUF2314 domain-containing protein, partial [Deltaproteobacteria bacterium]
QDRIAAESKTVTLPPPAKVETAPAAPAAAKVEVPLQSPPQAQRETKQAIVATPLPSVEAKPVAPSPAVPVAQPDTVPPYVPPGPATPSVQAQTEPAQALVATEPPQIAAPASGDTEPHLQQMAALNAAPAPAATAAATSSPATSTSPQQPSDAALSPAGQNRPRSGEAVAAVSPPVAEKPVDAVPPAAPKDGVISVLSEDKDMNAAIEKARASIGVFWKSYDGPAANETDHALKVAISGNGTTEHFWLTRIRREGDKFSGVISNRPQSVTSVKLGQRYEFTAETVSDWTFKRNGKLVGNETMRALLPRMPQEQAAVYRQMYETP